MPDYICALRKQNSMSRDFVSISGRRRRGRQSRVCMRLVAFAGVPLPGQVTSTRPSWQGDSTSRASSSWMAPRGRGRAADWLAEASCGTYWWFRAPAER